MKSLYLLILIVIGLSSCATTTCATKKTSVAENESQKVNSIEKSPLTVAMYTQGNQPSNLSYKVLGKETISKFNASGIRRQTASIHDAMSKLAAQMGGDAVINIANDDKTVTGTVITYNKSLKTSV